MRALLVVGTVVFGVGLLGAGTLHVVVGLAALCLGVGDLVDQAEGGDR